VDITSLDAKAADDAPLIDASLSDEIKQKIGSVTEEMAAVVS
jgi:hypothetical protein